MKLHNLIWCAFTFLIASTGSNTYANTLPDVSNLRVDGSRLVWDPLPGAAGYNVYSGALAGSNQGQGGFQYVTTVTEETSYQPAEVLRIYKIVGFSEGGAAFSDIQTAPATFLPEDVTVETESIDITFFNDSMGRYLVTNTCGNTESECIARCDHNGNAGNVTGGFCSTAPAKSVLSNGTQLTYQCSVTAESASSTITAGVYCAP